MRSSVDLPQPELPSSANSSPWRTFRLTLRTASVSPNFFTTSMIWTKFSARASAPDGEPGGETKDGAPVAGGLDWLFMMCCFSPAFERTKPPGTPGA
ncbi:hypothetical protein FEP90_05709 [Burkholderia multivorans]|nr:hypothetical protein [Burkholderia multivorans]